MSLRETFMRSGLFLVPLLGIAGILYLIMLFNDVVVEQGKLLDAFSDIELKKQEELRLLYAEITSNHIDLFDLLTQAAAGGDEGGLYDAGIVLLDKQHDSAQRFTRFSTTYPLTGEELNLYESLLANLESYLDAGRQGIEMSTVNLALSDKFVRIANNDFKKLSDNFAALVATFHENAKLSFSTLKKTTDRSLTTFLWWSYPQKVDTLTMRQ